jgi:hypothetical protein
VQIIDGWCLQVYDYLITFEQEVRGCLRICGGILSSLQYWMVWRSRTGFSFMKLAFFLNRYFPVIPSLFVLLSKSFVLLKNIPAQTYGNTAYDALDPTNAKVQ